MTFKLDLPKDAIAIELVNDGQNIKIENQQSDASKVSFVAKNGAVNVIKDCHFSSNKDGVKVPYVTTGADIAAEDWEIVGE